MNEISRKLFTYCLWLNSATAVPTEQLPEKLRALSGQLAYLLMGEHAGASSPHYFAVTRPQGRTLFIVLMGGDGRHGDNRMQYLALFSAVNAGVLAEESPACYGLLDFIRVGGVDGRVIELSRLNLSLHLDGNTLHLILFTRDQVDAAGGHSQGYGELHYRMAGTPDGRIELMQ